MSNKKKSKKKNGSAKPKQSTYSIVKNDDLRLYQPCEDVDTTRHAILTNIAFKMIATMNANSGQGLAHPQCDTGGLNLNIFVMLFSTSKIEAIINPTIILKSKTTVSTREGCLSLVDDYTVSRSDVIEVEYYSLHLRKKITKMLKGNDAICFQHEFDHLNATTIDMKGELVNG